MDDVRTQASPQAGESAAGANRTERVTSLAAGFARAAAPTPKAAPITTPSTGLIAGEVRVKTQDGDVPAYRALPAGKSKLPVILVVQEIFGVHEHIRDVCRRLAHLGYFAIAPELYARQGDASKVADVAVLIETIVKHAPDVQVMSDLDASVAFAESTGAADTSRVGITGFCWGGRIVLMYAAHNARLKAGVAWYGPTARVYHPGDKTAIEVAAHVKAAVLGLYGGADHAIAVATVEQEFAALKSGGNHNVAYHVYAGMPHAFFADYRPSYSKEAAEDGWKRATDWFKKYV